MSNTIAAVALVEADAEVYSDAEGSLCYDAWGVETRMVSALDGEARPDAAEEVTEEIQFFAEGKPYVFLADVLSHLGLPSAKHTRATRALMAQCLVSAGYRKVRRTVAGHQRWVYAQAPA